MAAPFTNLQDTLAAIGVGDPMWTVVYASHARQLASTQVAFRPVRAPGLAITTELAVHRTLPPPYLDLLLRACAEPAWHDHES